MNDLQSNVAVDLRVTTTINSRPIGASLQMPAECELLISTGVACAVPAVGRCSDCHRAFCDTHASAVTYRDRHGGGPPVTQYSRNCCGECAAEGAARAVKAAEEARAGEEAAARREEEELEAKLRAVVAALNSAGSPGIEIVRVEIGSKPGWFPRSKPRPIYHTFPPAYPAGTHSWRVSSYSRDFNCDQESSGDMRTGVTTSGEIISLEHRTGRILGLGY